MINRFYYLGLIVTLTVGMLTSPYASPAHGAGGGGQSPNQASVGKDSLQSQSFQKGELLPSVSDCPTARFPHEFRTIDGTNNNCQHPTWGSAPIDFLRLTKIGYDDGHDAPYDDNRPNVRAISNIVADQGQNDMSYKGKYKPSDMVWQWGQFLDHDLDLTPGVSPAEPYPIDIPKGDKHFDPDNTGTQTMSLDRSLYMTVNGVRQQMNLITAFIDASNVYGSDPFRAAELRDFNKGYLKTSEGDLPPFNENAFPNAPGGPNPEKFFLVGDFRGNEQVALTAMHTLFIREHNYWADYFREKDSTLNDENLYQYARAMVVAEMQHITYKEFLPFLLGKHALSFYKGYQPDVNPGISNVFATAAYRFGHSMVGSQLLRINKKGQSMGALPVREAFFNPSEVTPKNIEYLLRGLASQVAQRVDAHLVDDIRNFLFGTPPHEGFDLASLNMQRGREHGVASYNQVRKDFGLPPVKWFFQINGDPIIRNRLNAAYGNVDDIDMWMGGIAEKTVPGALVGRTVLTILKDQFERLRDGDRFWYETYLPKKLLKKVKKQTLKKIIKRNTTIGNELQKNVFLVP